jgi:flagellar biogenesis protein FliO
VPPQKENISLSPHQLNIMEIVLCMAAYLAIIMIVLNVLARISKKNDSRDLKK